MVTFNRIQPEVGTEIMATLKDPDGNITLTGVGLGWDWYVSKVTNPVANAPNHWAPATGVVVAGTKPLPPQPTPRQGTT